MCLPPQRSKLTRRLTNWQIEGHSRPGLVKPYSSRILNRLVPVLLSVMSPFDIPGALSLLVGSAFRKLCITLFFLYIGSACTKVFNVSRRRVAESIEALLSMK
jgi:hypothetical protein